MDETIEEIMDATYAALCRHGYASLRMQDIAAETSKSKATLHYHFETKEELLHAFLDYLFARFVERLDRIDEPSAVDGLLAVIDEVLSPPADDAHREFKTALLEIKAQGPYDERYRAQLERFDGVLYDRLFDLLMEGRASGEIDPHVDPADVADFMVTACNGAQTRYVSVGHPLSRSRDGLSRYVREVLAADRDGGGGR